jgi:hypothetical protein
VKIKGIDDKISNCDLLTAALLKLGSVDTLDADAVLDEMQALEQVLDQVQGNLVKKLGSEVGVTGITSLFKDAPVLAGDGNQGTESGSNPSRTISQGKSYLSSWRKLRSKSSAVSLTPAFSSLKDQTKDNLTLSTLPMTSLPNPRFAKRDVSQLDLSGPQSTYMSSLARLFDAVQVIGKFPIDIDYIFNNNDIFRPSSKTSRRPRSKAFITHACRTRALHETRLRVFRLLCLQVCPHGSYDAT